MYWIPQKIDGRMSGYYFCAHADHNPLHGVRPATKNLWTNDEIENQRAEEERAKEAVQPLP